MDFLDAFSFSSYFEDLLQMVLRSVDTGVDPVLLSKAYFSSVLTGSNVPHRDFAYVRSSRLNLWALCMQVRRLLRHVTIPLSPQLWLETLRLICPDFPACLVAATFAFVRGPAPLPDSPGSPPGTPTESNGPSTSATPASASPTPADTPPMTPDRFLPVFEVVVFFHDFLVRCFESVFAGSSEDLAPSAVPEGPFSPFPPLPDPSDDPSLFATTCHCRRNQPPVPAGVCDLTRAALALTSQPAIAAGAEASRLVASESHRIPCPSPAQLQNALSSSRVTLRQLVLGLSKCDPLNLAG
jgi:hypothetical protein